MSHPALRLTFRGLLSRAAAGAILLAALSEPLAAADVLAPREAVPLASEAHGPVARIKDIARVLEARDNQLIGYGLVVGLPGTGDSTRSAPFTAQSLRHALDRLGVPTAPDSIAPANVASVMVTAKLPHSAKPGARLDATVSTMGDATSLRGGVLLMTELIGADAETYALAQGSLLTGGFDARGAAEAVTAGVPSVAQLQGGAIVERAPPAGLLPTLTLSLRAPDFGTAVRVTDAINATALQRFGEPVASEIDAGTVALQVPLGVSAARFVAAIEDVSVRTDVPARVVVDERTGTVVVGADVRVSRVAVSHGQLAIRVTEQPRIVQPNPFARGRTAVEEATTVDVAQAGDKLGLLEGASLRELVAGLNALGVGPDGTIAILSSLKAAGALQAELIIQ